MLFEDILLLLLGSGAIYFIGIPLFQLVRRLFPSKTDSLADAKERLEQAKRDAAAADLNKQAEKIYDHLYEDALHEDDMEEENEETKHRRV
jgi:hypothetical protein